MNGDTIIPSASISLWGEYPYIYGDIVKNKKVEYFKINIENNSLSFSDSPSELFGDRSSDILKLLLTFQDVKGQFSSVEKLKLLQENLNKK